MRSEGTLDPIRSIRASWALLKHGGIRFWAHGVLLFALEFAGVCAFLLTFSAWSPVPESRCGFRAIHPGTLVIAGGLFVCSSASWASIARSSDPGAAPRGSAILITRFSGELLLLLALAPVGISVSCLGGAWRLAASIVALCGFAYAALGLSFVPQVAAFERLGVIDSLRRSWSLARGHRWRLLAHRGSLWVLVVLGACTCVGLFVVGPLVNAARIESYLALTRGRDREATRA